MSSKPTKKAFLWIRLAVLPLFLMSCEDFDRSSNAHNPSGVSDIDGSASKKCVTVKEHETAALACPDGRTIESIDFGSYGTPDGSCEAGFTKSTCHADKTLSIVEDSCLGETSCAVSASNGVFGDPCPGTFKRMSIIYTCTGAEDEAQSGLKATYFDNIDFTGASFERVDAEVNFDWGRGSPDPSIGGDTFSARWSGFVEAEHSETYTFYTLSDDGIRLTVNGKQLIDNWTNHPPTENSGSIDLQAGERYPIEIEYFENSGGAVAKLLWSSPSVTKQAVPEARLFTEAEEKDLCPDDPDKTEPGLCGCGVPEGTCNSDNGLLAVYFDNIDFTGASIERIDPVVDFDWGQGSPDPAIAANTFSARWTGFVEAERSETYTFYTLSDDGIRLTVNGKQIISNWSNHPPTENSGSIDLQAGERYPIEIEYFENSGGAVAKLLWSSPSVTKQIIPEARLFKAVSGDDLCPDDPNKTEPGVCGCGIEDTDSDGDGKADCNDGCPDDPNKTAPGTCGCGCEEAVITASGEFLAAGEVKENAFDGDATTKWLTFTNAAWIQYDFAGDESKIIGAYNITSANDAPERDPKDWRLLGSNDGVQFTTLDERSGETFPARFHKNTYTVAAPASFKMYRLDISSNRSPESSNITQLAEIELIEGEIVNDACPGDPDKTEPGVCGCGTPDVDSDGDGALDCNDECPNDSKKTVPGECGCGVEEGTCGTRPPDVYTEINTVGQPVVSAESYNIGQTTEAFEVPGHIAPTQRWTMRMNGLCGNTCRNGPRHMYTAAFEDTLFVSWMSVDEKDPWQQYGNVATFQVSSGGKFTLKSNVNLSSKCEATYGIATNSDGSIIALLCKGHNDTELLPGAINLLDTRRTPDCTEDWEGRCYPIGHYSAIDNPLYLFEYHGGKITQNPDKIVLINRAVGGWNYGHHELLLNDAQDTYFVHLKVTAGPTEDNRHEGLTHFAVKRTPDFEYVKVTDGWGCGAGHVLANRMAYNRATDSWSQLCTLDWCRNYSMYENKQCRSVTWYTVPGVTQTPSVSYEGDYLLELDHLEKDWILSGGGFALLSLGEDGYLALAAGPGYSSAQTKPDTLGLMRLPLTLPELQQSLITEQAPVYEGGAVVGEQDITRYQWNWLYLPDADPALGRAQRFGMGNMAYFSRDGEDSQRILLGWSPSIEFQGITNEYLVSEIDREGNLRGEPYVVEGAGWGEDNLWVTMPNSGCVVFPFAWVGDGPGKSYPEEKDGRLATDYPKVMHMTSLCPVSAAQPALADTPPFTPDADRWPPLSE